MKRYRCSVDEVDGPFIEESVIEASDHEKAAMMYLSWYNKDTGDDLSRLCVCVVEEGRPLNESMSFVVLREVRIEYSAIQQHRHACSVCGGVSFCDCMSGPTSKRTCEDCRWKNAVLTVSR